METCAVRDCERQIRAKGYCELHYRRFLKHGDPMALKNAPRHTTYHERIESRIIRDDPSGCWLWSGTHTRNGYAEMYYFATAEEANEAAVALRLKLFTHNEVDKAA